MLRCCGFMLLLALVSGVLALPAATQSSPFDTFERVFGIRVEPAADGDAPAARAGGNPSGTSNPAVPVNQTFQETLQLALAAGTITNEQIQTICSFRLGVYSYYWSVVGDPQTTVWCCLCVCDGFLLAVCAGQQRQLPTTRMVLPARPPVISCGFILC
jgi:hypothetical protein